MDLPLLLQYLAQTLGLDSLELNDDRAVRLVFGEDVSVQLEATESGDVCHIFSVLCDMPEDPASGFIMMDALLKANSFGRGTGGAHFSYDTMTNELLLGRQFHPDQTEPNELREWIFDMVSVIQIWRKRLPELQQESSAGDLSNNLNGQLLA